MTRAPFDAAVASAYESGAAAWSHATRVLYRSLADVLVAHVALDGARLVLDACCGTGAVASAIPAHCSAIVLDVAPSMVALASRQQRVVGGVVGDASQLPFPDATFDAALVGFGLNHSLDAAALLAECARVAGGGLVGATVFASGWEHPVKVVVDDVLGSIGWRAPQWHREMKTRTEPSVGGVDRLDAVAHAAGLRGIAVERVDVPTTIDRVDAVAWRWSMASHAGFVASLPAERRAAALAETLHRLEAVWAPVVVPVIVLVASAPRAEE